MKSFDLLKSPILLKSTGFIFLALAFFYFGKHWSDDNYTQVIFFNPIPNSISNTKNPTISISPNINKTFDIVSFINDTKEIEETVNDHTLAPVPQSQSPAVVVVHPLPPPPPPPPAVQRLGLVDENGVMRDDFEVGEFDPDVVESWNNETEVVEGDDQLVRVRVSVAKFGKCPASMREYIPCLDNVEAIKRLKSMENGEKFERHCPEKGKGLNCLLPTPKGYKAPIPWPRSRDEVIIFFRFVIYVYAEFDTRMV